jgi:PAS domain-containing protein
MQDTYATENIETLIKDLESRNAENQRLSDALRESEDRYNRMLENLKGEFLFYRHDTHGKFTYISPSYENILGFAPDEYIGMDCSDLWTPNPINIQADISTKLSCQGIRQPPYECG